MHQRVLRMMRCAQFCIFEMHQCMGQMGEYSLRKGVLLGNLQILNYRALLSGQKYKETLKRENWL